MGWDDQAPQDVHRHGSELGGDAGADDQRPDHELGVGAGGEEELGLRRGGSGADQQRGQERERPGADHWMIKGGLRWWTILDLNQ